MFCVAAVRTVVVVLHVEDDIFLICKKKLEINILVVKECEIEPVAPERVVQGYNNLSPPSNKFMWKHGVLFVPLPPTNNN